MRKVTTPKEELTLWQARPMEIVSRFVFCFFVLAIFSAVIQPRLIQSELSSGNKAVSTQEVKHAQKVQQSMFRKQSESTFEDD